ncbi:MAG: AAA family ATPase [Candidatus Aenigmarchaeota archaeon]|nr:AAA family ATPase [Candidatus Aenigmarchaeota archaeon]
MNSRIIINPEVLSQSHIAEKLLNREKELNAISTCLKNSINSFVYGSLGSGKTLLTKKAIELFNASKAKAIHIDCSLYQTTNAIFHEILLSLNSVVVSKSNYELTKRLKARTRNLDSPLTICLDHFEHLKEIETLNRILSLGLNLIIIAETYDSYRKLNQTIKASITSLIEIPSYTTDQVFDILINRAEEALEKYTYKEETIRKIASLNFNNRFLLFCERTEF